MTFNERKYREHLNDMIDKSINEVFDQEYEMPEISDLSQFHYTNVGADNGNHTNVLANNDYTPIKYGPNYHGWRRVVAANGMMGWVKKNGEQHPIMTDIGWLDYCNDFNPGRSAIASGMKDGVKYYVYKNGDYEKDSKRFSGSIRDKDGNESTYDDIENKVKNHDGTTTTHEITTNRMYDPTKFVRYATQDKRFFMEFVMVWTQHFKQNNKCRAGFNDEDETYFIDIENGPGVYDAIVELDQNLGNSINIRQVDDNTWRYKNQRNNGAVLEVYGGNATPGDPRQLSKGSIVFGKNIPHDNTNTQQEQQPNQSFEIETMLIDYYGFFNNTTAQWVLRIDQGLWLSAEDGSRIGTVKVEPNLAQWNFTLTHNNKNQFNFVIRDNELKDSGKGYDIASNIQLFYSTPNTMAKNRGIGAMDIIYSHKMKDNINLFEARVYMNLMKKIRSLNEGKEPYPYWHGVNDRPVDDSGSYWNANDEEIKIGREVGARREITIKGRKVVLTVNGTVVDKKIGPTGMTCYLIKGKSGKKLWVTEGDINTFKKRDIGSQTKLSGMFSEMVQERFTDLEGSATWNVGDAMYEAGFNDDEWEMCDALDNEYKIRFNGSEDSGDHWTPPSYDYEPDQNDVHEVECDINAIPDEKVRTALMKQFHSWLETAQPDMGFAEGPDPDMYRD